MKKFLLIFCLFFYITFSFAQEKVEVFFDFNKYEINEASKAKLETWILDNPEVEIVKLSGFCDSKGANRYNDSLSLQRANTVFDFLKNNHIGFYENLVIKGFGEDFKQSKIQEENRKVIFYYLKKEKNLSEEVKKAKSGDIVLLKNIYFKNRSADIVPTSKPTLTELLIVLEENPNLKIQVQGHVCCQLVSDYENISTARAKAIYDFLIQNKISPNRLSYKGFGVTKPIHPIPEKTEQEANENRRVEIMIVEN